MKNGNKYQGLHTLQFLFQVLVIGLVFSAIFIPFFIYELATNMLAILPNEETRETLSVALGVISFMTFGSAGLVSLAGSNLIGMAIDNRKDIRLIAKSLESISNRNAEKKTDQNPRESKEINNKEIPPWSP